MGKKDGEKLTTCTICGQQIPVDELQEHMRIELLDPRWKSQRDVLEARKAQASELQRGANVVSSLRNLARTRVDIFGAEEDEEQRKKDEEEERLRRRTSGSTHAVRRCLLLGPVVRRRARSNTPALRLHRTAVQLQGLVCEDGIRAPAASEWGAGAAARARQAGDKYGRRRRDRIGF